MKEMNENFSEEEALKLENQICFPLYVASRLITRAYQPLLDELGVTYPQYLVLMLLWEKKTLHVNEIAEELYLDTNTVTPLLKRMEQMYLIIRTRSVVDERKVSVALTEKAQKLKEKAKCIPQQLLEAIDLNMEELSSFRARLMKLIHTIEK